MSKAREIITELVADIQGGALTSWGKKKVDDVLSLLKDEMPKKKEIDKCMDYWESYPPNIEAKGYNQCAREVRGVLE